MKKIIPLLLLSVVIIFAAAGIGYWIMTDTSGEEEVSEKKVYSRGDGTNVELKEDNHWLSRQYIISIPTPEIVAVPAQEVKKQDFSPNADTVVDEHGYQTIPDNSTVTDITVRKLRTKYFTLQIPGCWVDHVVAECRYIDEKTDESMENPDAVEDTISLRFYEKQNYEAYTSGDSSDAPYATGLITELRYTSTVNDNSWLKTSNYETYIGTGTVGQLSYDMFLYEIHNSNDLTRPEYELSYGYLTKVNYPGCLASTLKVSGGGTIQYNEEIQGGYIDSWDKDGEGMAEGSVIPEDGLLNEEREAAAAEDSGGDVIPQATGEG